MFSLLSHDVVVFLHGFWGHTWWIINWKRSWFPCRATVRNKIWARQKRAGFICACSIKSKRGSEIIIIIIIMMMMMMIAAEHWEACIVCGVNPESQMWTGRIQIPGKRAKAFLRDESGPLTLFTIIYSRHHRFNAYNGMSDLQSEWVHCEI